MEKESAKSGLPAPGRGCLRALPGKLKAKVVKFAKSIKKLGQDDPRRITHSLKVAFALTLVSSIYYFRPLYDGFGVSGMWAVLTVVVIFEFTVGATLCKGLNRGFATFLAGALGVGAQHFARLFGEKGEPIVLGLLMFLLAAASTFTRFFPKIKARYDYGIVIFILTFSLVSVSGFRVEKLLELAHQRLSTIIIGGASCMIVSVFVCPVWAGEDLHKLIASNIEKLGNYLEGFGSEYFQLSESEVVSKDDKPFLKGYKSVLNSKSTEESLENFARWEPGHGRFRFRHPWHLYLKAGAQARQCAYQIEALNACLNSEIQVPQEFRKKIQEPCMKLSAESGKTLKELASAIKTMTEPSSANPHLENSKTAVKDLKTALKTAVLEQADILAIMPDAAVASILIEIVLYVEKISESIQEISSLAEFDSIVDQPTAAPAKPQLLHRGSVKPVLDGDSAAHVVIAVTDCKPTDLAENHEISQAPPVLHSCRRMEV